MSTQPPIPVGVRLPMCHETLPPAEMLRVCTAAAEMGYRSIWVGDHLLLPAASKSVYPHTHDGQRPFDATTPWVDPLLLLTWLSAQMPGTHFGTSVLILTLRHPVLIAKQIASMSWLTRRPMSIGVGTGWLRDEYDVVGLPFEKRATRAKLALAEIRELITRGGKTYNVRGDDDQPVDKYFEMKPIAPAPVEFLWGGFSPLALRLVASSCDGWLPAKQDIEQLRQLLPQLKAACDDAQRDFKELRLVAKVGPGPDPETGRVDRDNLLGYAELGFHEAIMELPLDPGSSKAAIDTLERVAKRSWL